MYSNSGLAQEDRFMSEQIYVCIIVKATHLLSVIICDLTNPDPSIIHFSSVSGTVNGLTNSSVIVKGSPKVLHCNYELASLCILTYLLWHTEIHLETCIGSQIEQKTGLLSPATSVWSPGP